MIEIVYSLSSYIQYLLRTTALSSAGAAMLMDSNVDSRTVTSIFIFAAFLSYVLKVASTVA